MSNDPVGEGAAPGSRALPRDLVRAITWARAHLGEAVGLAALARAGGVPPRTLEAHFRQFLGTTPIAWVRAARLEAARHVLLASGGRARVAEVALAAGFPQLGRFAAAYARRYEELPSATLRRLREPGDALEVLDDEAARLTWQALGSAFEVAPAACARALAQLEEARARAPGNTLAKAIAAWCHGQRTAHRFAPTPREDAARAVALAREAAASAGSDALTLSLASGALTLCHRLDEAGRLLDRALALEPGSPWARVRKAWADAYAGDAAAALRQFEVTLHLMPFEPVRHLAFIGIGCAHFVAGRWDRAARWARAGLDANPGSYWGARVVAAAAWNAGARDEARRTVGELLRHDEGLTAAGARRAWPFPPAVMDRLAEGLERAGLPPG